MAQPWHIQLWRSEKEERCVATSHEHRPAKQSMHSGNYQGARPALVDTIARPAHELHRELAQHAKQLRPLCVPSIGGKEGVFLRLYGGVGRVALEEAWQGREAAIIDWEDGRENDLGTLQAQRDVDSMLSARDSRNRSVVAWVGVELECRSWTMARSGGQGPPAIRRATHVMGLPGIRKCDEIKVKVGNQQYEIVMHWVDTCLGLGIPGYCENGVHSWLWHTPKIKEKLAEGVVWFAKR